MTTTVATTTTTNNNAATTTNNAWIGWATGGWGNGPTNYRIIVSAECPPQELIREGKSAFDVAVVRNFRPLNTDEQNDPRIAHAARRAIEEAAAAPTDAVCDDDALRERAALRERVAALMQQM